MSDSSTLCSSVNGPAHDAASAPVPASAATAVSTIFGDRARLAQRYADLLAGPGVARGLIGPRETARIWDRHILNCAVVAELLPIGAHVVDVGSGAGLPGIPLALARRDLFVVLVDTLRRRTDFLGEVIDELDFGGRVRVVTGRVEDGGVIAAIGETQWVTARAVAPLDRLAQWCLPLLRSGGVLLAIKGRRAEEEVIAHSRAVARAGGSITGIVRCGTGRIAEPARVVRITKD